MTGSALEAHEVSLPALLHKHPQTLGVSRSLSALQASLIVGSVTASIISSSHSLLTLREVQSGKDGTHSILLAFHQTIRTTETWRNHLATAGTPSLTPSSCGSFCGSLSENFDSRHLNERENGAFGAALYRNAYPNHFTREFFSERA